MKRDEKKIGAFLPGLITIMVLVLFLLLDNTPLLASRIPDLMDDLVENLVENLTENLAGDQVEERAAILPAMPAEAREPARETPSVATPAPKPSPTVPEGKKIPILSYHAVENDPFGDAALFVRPEEFEHQMRYMKENGYEAITFDHFDEMASTMEKPFIITFDDGYQDNYTQAYPILKKYGYQAVIFLCPDFVGGGSMLTREQIRAMRDIISFQSHTSDHRPLSELGYEEAEQQLRLSRERVESLTGIPVDVIAYPFGRYSQTIMMLSRKYYRYGLMMGDDLFRYSQARLFNIPRIFVRRGMDMETFIRKIQGTP